LSCPIFFRLSVMQMKGIRKNFEISFKFVEVSFFSEANINQSINQFIRYGLPTFTNGFSYNNIINVLIQIT
jgi:hypothetical protein